MCALPKSLTDELQEFYFSQFYFHTSSLEFSVVNMADELREVCTGGRGGAPVSNHEIRVNINTDTLLWKYLRDLQGLRGAGQEDEWEEKKDEWTQTFR